MQLSREGNGSVLASTTRDVSSSGFYCLSCETFAAGEYLDCTIVIPTYSRGCSEDRLCLQCRVEVVRVEHLDPGRQLGIACQIVDYSVVRMPAGIPTIAEARPA